MSRMLLLAAGAAALFAVAAPASAAPAGPQSLPLVVSGEGLVSNVYWRRGRCVAWRHECAARWGWGTWRFRRCLRIHGC